MRLLGAPTIDDISGSNVITRNLHDHTSNVPRDHLLHDTYVPLQAAGHVKSNL